MQHPHSVDAAPPGRRQVIVTRPREQAAAWVAALHSYGIDALGVPLIGIAEAADTAAIDAAWAAITDWSLLVFVSPNAVSRFFAHRPPAADWPASSYAASPGPGTSALLRAQQIAERRLIEPLADAANFDSEALWQRLRLRSWRDSRVLIVRGDGGRNWLADQLRDAGATVEFLAAYRRGPAAWSATERTDIARALAEPQRHLWFFSSSEAITNLMQAEPLPAAALRDALARSTAIATHPRIAATARAAGFATVIESRPAMADVVACIQSQPSLGFSSVSPFAS